MTEKDLEEMKQKYGFTLHPSVFNGKPIKYVSKEEYDERMSKVKSVDTETMADLRKELEYMKQYPEAYKYQRALMMIKKSFIEELKDYKNDDLAKMSKEEEMNFELLQELVDRFTKESESEDE